MEKSSAFAERTPGLSRGLLYATVLLAVGTIAAGGAGATPICVGNCNFVDSVSVGSFNAGDGALTILSPDQVSAPGGTFVGAFGSNEGAVAVSGPGARLDSGGAAGGTILFVGSDGGTGSLTIADGAVVTSNAVDAGAAFGDARLFLGSGGQGVLTIESGGTLAVQDLGGFGADDGLQIGRSIGLLPGSGSMTVTGTGSSARALGNLAFVNVGQANTAFSGTAEGHGTLQILDGAQLQIEGYSGFGALNIGIGGNSQGTVTVSGAGSELTVAGNPAVLVVAGDGIGATGTTGVGQLFVTNGGRVDVSAANGPAVALIGSGLGSGLAVVDSGGEFSVGGNIFVSTANSNTGNTDQRGVILINGTGTVTASGVTVIGDGDQAITGIVAGTGTLNSDTVVRSGGLLQPGLSPGTFTIGGDLTFAGGWLEIEIGGTALGAFDVLNVGGIADFTNSNILFSFLNGFLPSTGDIFDFIFADSVVGFSSANLVYRGVPLDFAFDVMATESGLSLGTLRGQPTPVPEPGTFVLLVAGLLGLCCARSLSNNSRA